jgi:phosphoserine aminotransferase
MYNTPPTFSIYVAGLIYKWILSKGGLAAIERLNREKATLLYDAIDSSRSFTPVVMKTVRSRMNVTFLMREPDREKQFLDGAKQRGLVELKGHRSVGGLRASLYNSMTLEGTKTLVDYMKEFDATSTEIKL